MRLARRRAHPCDEQVKPPTCSFSLSTHVKNAWFHFMGGA